MSGKRKIYVDTNVLINYSTNQSHDVECLNYLFRNVRKELLFTSSLAVVQAISVLQTKKTNRKKFSKKEITDFGNEIFRKFSIIELSKKDIEKSFNEDNEDVEDSVHYILANKLKCNVLITNNIGDFRVFRNKIITLTPKDLQGVRRVVSK